MNGDQSFQDSIILPGNSLNMPETSARRVHHGSVAANHQDGEFIAATMPVTVGTSENGGEVEEGEEVEDQGPAAAIGTVMYNGRFKCNMPARRCSRATFGRMNELRRHYDTVHVVANPVWCVEPLCVRTLAAGGKPFPRLDKLRDHERKVHHR